MTESVPSPDPSADTAAVARLAPAMRLAFWTLVVETGVSLLIRVLNWYMFSLPSETFERWMRPIWGFNALADICVMSVFAFVSLRLASASTPPHRRLATAAAMFFVGRGLLAVFNMVALLAALRTPSFLTSPLTVLAYVLFYGSWGLLLAGLGTGAKAWGFRFPLIPGGVALLFSIAGALVGTYWRSLIEVPLQDRPGGLWLPYVRDALSYSSTLVLAAVFFLSRSRLLRARDGLVAELKRASSPEWRAASEGLTLYRGALLARIAVMLIGTPLLFLASRSGEQEPSLGLLKVMTLGTLACGLAALVGLFGYSKIPESSGARGHARSALGLGLTGGVFDVWAVILIFRLSGSVSAAFTYMDQAPWVEAGAQTAGLVALLFLLASFHQAAGVLKASELASRAQWVGWTLGIAGFSSMIFKLVISTTRGATEVVILALPLVFALVGGAIAFVSLVGELARAMHEGPPQAEEPSLSP
ncbi:hypothetical protein [Hyalangium versicolor]|uniref:hypothetical protein n=1 Tax=Hyalangium versicolor TaxID=2861190 RepID=UPI001CCBB376|nr:hypothetical protein [Hyalangium versicolor]